MRATEVITVALFSVPLSDLVYSGIFSQWSIVVIAILMAVIAVVIGDLVEGKLWKSYKSHVQAMNALDKEAQTFDEWFNERTAAALLSQKTKGKK